MEILNYTGRNFNLLAMRECPGCLYITESAHRFGLAREQVELSDTPISWAELGGRTQFLNATRKYEFSILQSFEPKGCAKLQKTDLFSGPKPGESIEVPFWRYEERVWQRGALCVEPHEEKLVGLPNPKKDILLIVHPEVAMWAQATERGASDLLIPSLPVFTSLSESEQNQLRGDFMLSPELCKFLELKCGLYLFGYLKLVSYCTESELSEMLKHDDTDSRISCRINSGG